MRWAAACVLAVLLLGAAPARAGTIVFDFEDGLQGWELSGAVQRVQTQLLGGEWAIFGDGFTEGGLAPGASLFTLALDLTDIVAISLERFLVDGNDDALRATIIERRFSGSVGEILFEPVAAGNPNLIAINISAFTGSSIIVIYWDNSSPAVAFIDNITFHTIPEPSVLGMLVMGGVVLIWKRRRR